MILHLCLDEKEIQPDGRKDLCPNGFYAESCINDFPIRDYRTILHVRRRRWKDADGKSHSKDWQLVAQGTRHSVEFAAFLKEFIGYVPDYSSFAPETDHIKGDEFERAYKEFLSGYRTWEELAHADQWLVFPENVGPRVSIDETSLSRGELYTIVANKDGRGKQGTLIAIVKGTKIEDVVAVELVRQ